MRTRASREPGSAWAQRRLAPAVLAAALVVTMQAQTDPGVRDGAAGAGGPIAGLTLAERIFFNSSQNTFEEVDSVTGSISGTGAGLGPRFNMDSCAGCHAQPAVGGSSPFTNPQVAVATKNGATNTAPSFITLSGPVREVRFKFADPPANTIRDGGVHDLYTITGRTDAPGCNIAQPDFATAAAQNNLIFRIPTPTFGAGLIEAILDSAIVANKNANLAAKSALGIAGHENREGNTGTVTRFGWKAQNKSLLIFSGEAYNVEQGVTNLLFPNERDETPGCLFNGTPEDHMNFNKLITTQVPSDTENFTTFMRFLAPPAPVTSYGSVTAASIANGRALFISSTVGCALCHTPSLQTGASSSAALSNKVANLFSDMLVHHVGPGLADNIPQGNAAPDEFRSAPLWGLGHRIFFLHDGRTTDLLAAIAAHASTTDGTFPDSEANASIAAFNSLSPSQKQDLLNFLRSL